MILGGRDEIARDAVLNLITGDNGGQKSSAVNVPAFRLNKSGRQELIENIINTYI